LAKSFGVSNEKSDLSPKTIAVIRPGRLTFLPHKGNKTIWLAFPDLDFFISFLLKGRRGRKKAFQPLSETSGNPVS